MTNETQSLRDARAYYFRRAGFAADGGYNDRWVVLRAGRIPVSAFPNIAARRRAVWLHDLHHVLTGYDTSWTGEAEIAAWELASGCGRFWVAWVLNAGAMAVGMLIAPRRTLRAFARGRRSGNLYAGRFDDAVLERTVGSLRAEIGVAPC